MLVPNLIGLKFLFFDLSGSASAFLLPFPDPWPDRFDSSSCS